MIVGIAREIKPHEYRVSMTPQGARRLVQDGHWVLVEEGAGTGCGFSDDEYRQAGAHLVDRETLFGEAELLVKVKEPVPEEYALLRVGHIIFTYLHLAPNRPLTELLLERKITAFAYETLEKDGHKPLLAPMSEIAGRMAPLVGGFYLQRHLGGNGVMPCGVPGVSPARAAIIGAGTVGRAAARIAVGIGMETVVLNRGVERLREIDLELGRGVMTRLLDDASLIEELAAADIVVGALYATGKRTPVVIGREMLARMKPGAVIVDVAIDQGGCAATSWPTTHDAPVFSVEGIMHYCVANMPSAYPHTSTQALAGATLPYILHLARLGIYEGVLASAELATALNVREGTVIHSGLAESLAANPALA